MDRKPAPESSQERLIISAVLIGLGGIAMYRYSVFGAASPLVPWLFTAAVLGTFSHTAYQTARRLNADQLSFSTLLVMMLTASAFVGLNCQLRESQYGWPSPVYLTEPQLDESRWVWIGISFNGILLIALLFCVAYGMELCQRGREKNEPHERS